MNSERANTRQLSLPTGWTYDPDRQSADHQDGSRIQFFGCITDNRLAIAARFYPASHFHIPAGIYARIRKYVLPLISDSPKTIERYQYATRGRPKGSKSKPKAVA